MGQHRRCHSPVCFVPLKVSVIIPTYDRPTLLPRAVESARAAGANVEIVVVDDGSKDDTRRVCEQMRDVVYVRNEICLRVGGARRTGIDASSGEFLSFLDDDDVRLPGSLDVQVRALQADPSAGLAYGHVHRGSANLSLTGRTLPRECLSGDVFWELLRGNFIPSISAVFRRSAFTAVGGLRAEFAPSDDWDLWVRIAEQYTVTCVHEPVAIWREATFTSGQGSSRALGGVFEASMKALGDFASLRRVREDDARFRIARSVLVEAMVDRLLRETVEAVRHADAYGVKSLRASVMLSFAAVCRRLLRARSWRLAIGTLRGRDTRNVGL
jgi:glycosyltransferase involved in cell wall biosynthesis